jgi:O-antigen/teichoic acid export membrane protein
LNPFKTLFKHTFVYGLATVLPRMLSFLLVPLYTKLFSDSDYGIITIVFSYLIFFNVILSYGMETTVFRFFTKQDHKDKVISTATLSIIFSSLLFLIFSIIFNSEISNVLDLNPFHYKLITWVLFFDAICVIPFAYLRINKKSIRYAVIKIINVAVNLCLNVFFLLKLPSWKNDVQFLNSIYVADFRIEYIFISFIISSGLTFLLLSPFFVKLKYQFDAKLWKSMMKYALPVLVAGLAFSINETLDKILLNYLLPENIAKSQVGVYAACYKLAMFMTLFATAYRLGIEPFFFSHSQTQNPKKAYALVTKYFVICGIFILLFVVVFIDYLKLIIQNDVFYEALGVVPILLIANLCLGVYHNLSVWYKITDRTKFGAIISSFGAVVTLAINIIFIPLYGFKASAIATLCAYGSMMLLSYAFGQKYYKINYPLKRLAIYSLLGISFSMLSFYFFRAQIWIGILFILSYLILAFSFEKRELLYYIKKT